MSTASDDTSTPPHGQPTSGTARGPVTPDPREPAVGRFGVDASHSDASTADLSAADASRHDGPHRGYPRGDAPPSAGQRGVSPSFASQGFDAPVLGSTTGELPQVTGPNAVPPSSAEEGSPSSVPVQGVSGAFGPQSGAATSMPPRPQGGPDAPRGFGTPGPRSPHYARRPHPQTPVGETAPTEAVPVISHAHPSSLTGAEGAAASPTLDATTFSGLAATTVNPSVDAAPVRSVRSGVDAAPFHPGVDAVAHPSVDASPDRPGLGAVPPHQRSAPLNPGSAPGPHSIAAPPTEAVPVVAPHPDATQALPTVRGRTEPSAHVAALPPQSGVDGYPADAGPTASGSDSYPRTDAGPSLGSDHPLDAAAIPSRRNETPTSASSPAPLYPQEPASTVNSAPAVDHSPAAGRSSVAEQSPTLGHAPTADHTAAVDHIPAVTDIPAATHSSDIAHRPAADQRRAADQKLAADPGPSQELVLRPRADIVPVYPKRRSLPQHRRARIRGRVRRRTVWVLVLSQVFGALGATIGVAVASLLAKDVSGSERLAGSAQTMQAVGSAIGALIIAKVAMRHGRRFSLAIGYFIGALGSGLCVLSGALMNFPLLLTGAMMLGAATAAGMQARFAATDLAEPAHRGRDLSTVVWSSTIGAVLGPNLVTVGERVALSMSLPALTGPFVLAAVGLALAGGTVAVLLRPDPMRTAAEWKREDDRVATEGDPFSGPMPQVRDVELAATRPHREPVRRSAWTVIRSNPVILAAVLANALNQAVMVSVMIMTPVHMHHGHADMSMIGFTISLHMVGMFAFSPVFGWLTDRLGPIAVLILGTTTNLMAVLMTASAPEGHSMVLMGGLHILGVGWSLTIISASTLLTGATPQQDRALVQGWSDLATGFAAALGGLLAGEIVAQFSYGTLSLACIPAVVALYICALVAARCRRRQPAPA